MIWLWIFLFPLKKNDCYFRGSLASEIRSWSLQLSNIPSSEHISLYTVIARQPETSMAWTPVASSLHIYFLWLCIWAKRSPTIHYLDFTVILHIWVQKHWTSTGHYFLASKEIHISLLLLTFRRGRQTSILWPLSGMTRHQLLTTWCENLLIWWCYFFHQSPAMSNSSKLADLAS